MKTRVRLEHTWVAVPTFEGIYEVSNYGWVRRVGSSKPLKPGRVKRGYLIVVLFRNSKGTTFSIHKLVCTVFVGPKPSPKHEVNHDNGHKDDNWDGNLYWTTRSENMKHAYRTGLRLSYSMQDRS